MSIAHTFKHYQFAGIVVFDSEQQKKRFKLNVPQYFEHTINQMKEGQTATLTLTEKKPRRTLAQNAYYWGVYLPLIAKETGEADVVRLHYLFRGMFLTTQIVEVLGHKTRVIKSTTDLSVGEFCEYILKIEELTGVEAPPTENYQLAPLRK